MKNMWYFNRRDDVKKKPCVGILLGKRDIEVRERCIMNDKPVNR